MILEYNNEIEKYSRYLYQNDTYTREELWDWNFQYECTTLISLSNDYS